MFQEAKWWMVDMASLLGNSSWCWLLANKALGNSSDCGIHCIKGLAVFPSPAGMSLTKLSLMGNNLLFPAKESLISDIPAGDGKTANLFLQCTLLDSNLFITTYVITSLLCLYMCVSYSCDWEDHIFFRCWMCGLRSRVRYCTDRTERAQRIMG